MNASDPMTPAMRPYLPATADFAAGRDSPRRFLERCLTALEAWEPKVGAFVTLTLAAAREAADRASARWRAGRPVSAIDGMPLGIKDIIETIDMPTENGSPLFPGFRRGADGASVARRAVDDRVPRDRAARHPQSVGCKPHAGRLQQRLGGRGRGRRDQRRARHPGDRLDPPAGEVL